jgi:hypothetical protein
MEATAGRSVSLLNKKRGFMKTNAAKAYMRVFFEIVVK